MMSEVTIRAEPIVKLTDGLMDATWTFKAGTPRDIVLRDLTGGHYQKLQRENDALRAVVEELCSDYEPEIEAKYAGTLNFPCRQRDYDSDMDVIKRARKLIETDS